MFAQKLILGSLRWRLAQMLSAVKAAKLRRDLYLSTLSELRGLSDRELADLGIPRAHIRRIALETSRKDKT
ncbi:DUF1127 domain-containing protein [Pseudophaeobacter leonis]|uniref:DUF1127 domain-containing protein n=1 Tax=Pseudophaeobacter leonis TaxID=1144477 RepID=UPI0009F2B2C5